MPIMWILAGGWAFGAVMYFDRSAFLAIGRANVALWVAVLQNIVGVLLVFAFVPFGIFGVAFSRWSRIVTWPVRIWALHRLIGLPVWKYLGQVFRCVISMIPVVVAIAFLQTTAWSDGDYAFWTFAVPLGAGGMVVYTFLLWAFAGHENRMVLRQLAIPIRNRITRRR